MSVFNQYELQIVFFFTLAAAAKIGPNIPLIAGPILAVVAVAAVFILVFVVLYR